MVLGSMEPGSVRPQRESLQPACARHAPRAEYHRPAPPAAAPAHSRPHDAPDDALAATLARAVAARPGRRLLQRKYWLYDASGGQVGPGQRRCDGAQVARSGGREQCGARATSRRPGASRPKGELRSALGRMIEETDRDTVKGYVLEAIGFNAPTKDWTFVSRENAARAVLAESLRSRAEGTETALAKQVLGTAGHGEVDPARRALVRREGAQAHPAVDRRQRVSTTRSARRPSATATTTTPSPCSGSTRWVRARRFIPPSQRPTATW